MYAELKHKHQTELNAFRMRFAFTQKQLDDILSDWGVEKSEVVSLPSGGIIMDKDQPALLEMFARFDAEMQALFASDEGLTDALYYELCNHEYGYTYDVRDALEPLGLDLDEFGPRENDCLQAAKDKYWSNFEG